MYEEELNTEDPKKSQGLENDKFKILAEAIHLNTEELKDLKAKITFINIDEVIALNKAITKSRNSFNENMISMAKILSLQSDFNNKLQNIEGSIHNKMESLVGAIPDSVALNKIISLDNSPKSLISLFSFLVVLVTVLLGYQVISNNLKRVDNNKYREVYNEVYKRSSVHNKKIMDEIYYSKNQ